MSAPSRCPRCQGAMESGFLVDRGDYESQRQATWASGTPAYSIWRNTAIAKGERTMLVATYRCERCGFLESYATEVAKR